jgi:hypothetical protein
VLVLVTSWLTSHIARSGNSPNSAFQASSEINFDVAVVETGGSHDEVTAALYYAIGSVPGVHTSMYLAMPRYKIENIYAWLQRRLKLSPYSISKPYELNVNDKETPDIIVLATCEHDLFAVDTALHHNFEHGTPAQSVVCVIHHADKFKAAEERLRRWARAGRLRFMTLSTHTAETLRSEVDQFGGIYKDVHIDVFPPVFPVPLSPTPPQSNRLSIAIQGNFEDTRRDYLNTFLDFERMIEELPETITSRMQFTILGNGKYLGVPQNILPYVSVNFSLDYITYYNLLHQAFAILPAFADDDYYKTKASSSVPASLIAQSPIVGSPQLLESYKYLSQASTWKAENTSEGEMHAVYEILRRNFDDEGKELSSWREEVGNKRIAVKQRAAELMEQNTQLMRQIILKEGSL